MTPQLRQSIEMLQMSTTDLVAHLAEQVEANPVLSMADGTGSLAPTRVGESVAGVDEVIARATDRGAEVASSAGGPARGAASGARSGDGEGLDRAARLPELTSLADHVAAQVCLMRLEPATREVALRLAGDLDEDGYLRVEDAMLAAGLGVDESRVGAARAAIQQCEPTGVGARDLAEALRLQLIERDRLDAAMEALLGVLDRLPTTPAAILARDCGVPPEEFRAMLAVLRSLDPRPGRRHAAGTAIPALPDVIVRADGRGGWRVALNPAALPRLLVDRDYAASVSATRCKETKRFLSTCLQEAGWLRRSLDQRARTILAVAVEVVRVQGAYFERGGAGLRPLTLKMVAEEIGMHESTVSRVTANKLMATPRGTVPMKAFFTASIAAADGGEAHAAGAVRERIRALVAAEPSGKPLSDDMLVKQLGAEGIEVARRTVAKYREAMRIPSSVERRRRAAAAVC
jgi:RNA polymerase sigma-54 factor